MPFTMNVKKVYFAMGFIVVAVTGYLFLTSIKSVRIDRNEVGLGWYEESTNQVQYGYGDYFVNYSVFPKQVTIRAYDKLDYEYGWITQEDIVIETIEVTVVEKRTKEKISYEGNVFIIPPLKKCWVDIEGYAPYGEGGLLSRGPFDVDIVDEKLVLP